MSRARLNICTRAVFQALPWALFVLNFAALALISWRKCGNAIVDTYQSLYVFRAVAEGQILYHDLSYYFGPFAPYLHALIFQIFGVHNTWLYLIGFVLILLTSCLLFRLVKELTNQTAAWLSVFIFLNLSAFNDAGKTKLFNFVLPYNYSSVYGIVFTLAALLFQLRTYRRRSLSSVSTWSIMTAGIALNRPDFALGYFLLSLAFIAFVMRTQVKECIRTVCVFALPFIAICGSVYGYFAYRAGLSTLIFHNIFWFGHLPGLFDVHQAFVIGFRADPLLAILSVLAFRGLALLPLLYWAGWKNRISLQLEKGYWLIVLLAVGAFHLIVKPENVFADLQVALLLCFLALIRRPQGKAFELCLTLLAFFSISRVLFRTSLASYLFYQGIIPLVVIVFVMSDVLAQLPVMPRRIVRFYLTVFLCSTLLRIWDENYANYTALKFHINTPVGSFYTNSFPTQRALARIIKTVNKMRPRVETVLVLPEGASVNFYTGTRHPIYHPTVFPHVIRAYGEGALIEEIRANSPEIIVMLHHFNSTWGEENLFSKNFGVNIADWVNSHYLVLERIGPSPFTNTRWNGGGAVILVRPDLARRILRSNSLEWKQQLRLDIQAKSKLEAARATNNHPFNWEECLSNADRCSHLWQTPLDILKHPRLIRSDKH